MREDLQKKIFGGGREDGKGKVYNVPFRQDYERNIP